MNKNYNLKLDLQFRCNNSVMKFNQFDNNTSDFFIQINNGGKSFDIEKAIVVLATIKPSGKVASQFVEVENDTVYADLKSSMRDEIGTYTAQAMLILEDERVVTDTINYEVNESKIISAFIEDAGNQEDYNLLTDMLNRLSTIEITEEQRQINEAERILSEENRKTEEAKRVEAELIRQHEEADRAKYDATRESNENIRKQNESIRLANETNRIDEEAKRVEEENKRKLAEEERNANYNFMTEDEERRRSEANAHKEAEVLRVQAETNRVNEEAKRRTTEQARVSAENTRVSNENTREASEIVRKNNETKRVEAETQRQNRYNSFISDAEANANNFENYTNNAKVKEEERKANELDRQTQENKRVSNEVERISNENTRKANEVVREKNEASRQDVFENKVSEVDEKISEINTTKDNFISSINTKVDNKISELDNAKTDMTNTVSNKVNEVETRFNALTASQQQSSEVIDARDGETSLKARLDRDIEKAKQVYVPIEGNHISTDSSVGYLKDVEILGNTVQDASNLADIRSVGDKVEGQELYEIPVLSVGKNLFNTTLTMNTTLNSSGIAYSYSGRSTSDFIKIFGLKSITISNNLSASISRICLYDKDMNYLSDYINGSIVTNTPYYLRFAINSIDGNLKLQLEEGTQATPYEPYQEDKLTILSPTPLEKVGDVADRIIEKDGVWGVEKNNDEIRLDEQVFNTNDTSAVAGEYVKLPITYSKCSFDNSLIENGYCITTFGARLNSNDWSNCTKEGIYIGKNAFGIVAKIETIGGDTKTHMKNYFLNKNHKFKRSVANPTFIPLPHDQQMKLRTFANKTNISFLTEIEGTIKAQVPKSLGATVNTHTEQINSLNKELDRVKKLEESTVSTVTTESDFTTVEATSNGYFEDVKLEGKTLVNICPKPNASAGDGNHLNNVIISDNVVEITVEEGRYTGVSFTQKSPHMKPNTTYTIVANILENTMTKGGIAIIEANPDTSFTGTSIPLGYKGLFVEKTTTKSTYTLPRIQSMTTTTCKTGEKIKFSLMVLEGDHTQNPPSYFEGLKSVGDGVDEIVVSSVNENLFNPSSCKYNTSIFDDGVESPSNSYVTSDFIRVESGLNYYVSGLSVVIGYDLNKNFIKIFKNTNVAGCITIPTNCSYIRIRNYNQLNTIDLQREVVNSTYLIKGSEPKPYTPYKADKKRLLYYNEETQTWEKPILREWDSIEKHANGKYYYHQRSGEVVLNGSENTTIASANEGLLRFYIDKSDISVNGNVKSDRFNNILGTVSEESVYLHPTRNQIVIVINASKLTTQDVAGFKQWLQANNVTVVYQLAQEKVYECTNIDLITYANETNYIVECGAIVPRTTLKVHNNISNVVSLLQKKVSLLESNITSYMITQNRLQLSSTYSADSVTFKVDYFAEKSVSSYDNDLFNLILSNILVGKENYDYDKMFNIIMDYASWSQISWDQFDILVEMMDLQHNPPIELPTEEFPEETPEE